MKVRILKGFSDYLPGQVFEDWPGGMCEILVARGLIEEVLPAGLEAVETAEESQDFERAESSPKRRKK